MRRTFILLVLAAIALQSCRQNKTNTAVSLTQKVTAGTDNTIIQDGVTFKIVEIKLCHYPEKDPLVEKKWGKKLLLFCMEVYQSDKANKKPETPQGAMITDSKGNSYGNQPGVIAMAQQNNCIKGDDIQAYNLIWNGEMKKGDKQTAYVLGFEVPEDASPEKLYWNNNWKNDNIFFLFQQTDYAINH